MKGLKASVCQVTIPTTPTQTRVSVKGLEAGGRTCPGPLSGGFSEVQEPKHLDYYDCYFHSDVLSQ